MKKIKIIINNNIKLFHIGTCTNINSVRIKKKSSSLLKTRKSQFFTLKLSEEKLSITNDQ